MFERLIDFFAPALQSQVGGTAIALSVIGAAFALLRNVPSRVSSLLRRQFIMSVDVPGNDTLFSWLVEWLDSHPYSRRSRLVTASVGNRSDAPSAPGEKKGPPPILFSPAPGNHLLWYRGRPVWLTRERKDLPSRDGSYAGYAETLTLRTIGRDVELLRTMLAEARDHAHREQRRVTIYTASYEHWRRMSDVIPRPLSTVILPVGVMEAIATDADEFLTSQQWYAERGIPWRRGYLFEGPPGTGKSSAIAAAAGYLKVDLYVCTIADKGMSDSGLMRLLSDVPPRSALLIEDIDAVVRGRDVAGENGVTFAGLLNALDGVASREGILTFMTTNHVDQLDPALIRSGRVDYRLSFGLATEEQLIRLFQQFYSSDGAHRHAAVFARAMAGRSMAEAQGVLLEHKRDPAAAVAVVRDMHRRVG